MSSRRVSRSFAIDGTTDKVVLFSWSTDTDALKRNVARIDRHGNVVWRAELPGKAASDCFNSLERDKEGFVARTYSEWTVHLNLDGQTLRFQRDVSGA